MSELRQARLPEGWKVKKLGDVCVKTANIKWEAHKGEGFQYIDLSAVSRESLKITGSSHIDSTNAPSRAKKVIYSGDVLNGTKLSTFSLVFTSILGNFHLVSWGC